MVYCGGQSNHPRLAPLWSPVPSTDAFSSTKDSQSYMCDATHPPIDSLRSPVPLLGDSMCNATQARLDSLQSPVPSLDMFGIPPSPQSHMCNVTDSISQTKWIKPTSKSHDLPKIGSFTQHECFENILGQEEHCLYVNSNFSSGRGMSIFTRPSILKEDFSQLPIFKSDSFVVTQAERRSVPFNVTPIAGKGIGALATRQISKGEVIISDHAATVIIVEFSAIHHPSFGDICVSAFDLLPSPTGSLLMKLDAAGHTRVERVHTAIARNAFETPHGSEEVLHYAVVPEPSVFNHECRPNSAFFFDKKTLRVYINAVRDIAMGEEITIAYRDMKASRAERQASIAHYGFQCKCSHCSMSAEESKASDERIQEIDTILDHLADYSDKSKANLDMADRLIQLYREERFDGRMAEPYTLATMAYNSFGEIDEVKKLATLARAAGILFAGPAWAELSAIEEMQEDPKSHWSYNVRQGMRSRQTTNE
ncbi:uncharacterized protein MELLADRAFT_91461 [Melampsora larici-populina 98AG31]|uniref:SET domain-containing protein n=1 Tax=Melampsora larici-populina (strain 98AG31 / pathotype 3-4-7) TaxID=747676 RepID=F4RZ50_MELLP|nr:uncharacterized protein MELLADRAFT_91461 [Melampsora larici-populina 98AG31]EGG02378.1 hypothetical protein MELLADRAFT_91461 [Melampsora larici-populina 98AG31]